MKTATALAFVLFFFAAALIDRDRETCVPCPNCNGRGHHIVEEGTAYHRVNCDLCNAAGVVSVSVMRAWKESKR